MGVLGHHNTQASFKKKLEDIVNKSNVATAHPTVVELRCIVIKIKLSQTTGNYLCQTITVLFIYGNDLELFTNTTGQWMTA